MYRVRVRVMVFNTTFNNISNISNIPYNLIFTAKFNDSSILIAIFSCDYLNLSLANEYVGDVTIPTQVIENNQHFLQADQPIRLQYSNQIKLFFFKPQEIIRNGGPRDWIPFGVDSHILFLI